MKKTEVQLKCKSVNFAIVHPQVSSEEHVENITSFTLTDKYKRKMNKLSAKYGISRSAIVRILLDNVE